MHIQEAIKRIQDHIRVHKIGEYPHINLKRALDMALDALVEKERNKWILVEDKLPEDGVLVLVTDDHHCDTGIYDAEDDCFSVDHAFIDPNNVAAWKPFPEEP